MLRALEVHQQTGRPLSAFPMPTEARRDHRILSIGLKRDRSELNERIRLRVEAMFSQGLADEVADLRRRGARAEHPGMKGIGYREWFPDESGRSPSLDEVKEMILRDTRRYAKRQMTFFASLPGVRWFTLEDRDEVPAGLQDLVEGFLGKEGCLDQEDDSGHNP